MSDSILKFIPCNPNFIPLTETQSQAEDVIWSYFPDADSVHMETSEGVQFVDAGENWGEIGCPSCGVLLNMDWWSSAMGEASEDVFHNLDVETPCCGSKVSLNSLNYEFTVGFAKFIVEVLNPSKNKLDNADLKSLETIFGCDLKMISAFI